MTATVPKWTRRLDTGLLFTLLMCTFAILPELAHPGLFLGHDTLNHAFRVAELNRLWSTGILLPRWAETFYFGYGSPVFQYYAPLTYYLSAGFVRLFGLDALGSLRLLVILCLPIAGAGMYLFTRQYMGKFGGILAALVYVYSPYIVFTQPVTRGAYPELLCCALFPWVIWRFTALVQNPRLSNIAWASLLLTLLILSHNLLSVVFSALLIGWLLWGKLWHLFGWHQFRTAIWALLLGLGLSAFFWLPILLGRNDVHLANVPQDILSEHGNFFGFFVPLDRLLTPSALTDAGAANGILLRLNFGLAAWLLAIVGLFSIIFFQSSPSPKITLVRRSPFHRWRGKGDPNGDVHPLSGSGGLGVNEQFTLVTEKERGSSLSTQHPALSTYPVLCTLYFVLCTILILPLAAPLWESIPAMNIMEFPWRLLGPIAFCLAFLAGLNAVWIDRLSPRLRAVLTPIILSLPIALALPTLYIPESRAQNIDTSQAAYLQSETTGRISPGTSARNDFLPATTLALPGATQSLLDDYADGYPVDKANREIIPPDSTVTLLDHTPQSDSWGITAAAPFTLEVLTFDFPGWTARLDGEIIPITPSQPYGFITIPIPSGDHTLSLTLEPTPAQNLGGAATFISIIFLIVIIIFRTRPNPHTVFSQHSAPSTQHFSSLIPHPSHLIPFSLAFLLTLAIIALFMRQGSAWVNSPPGQAVIAQHPAHDHLGEDIQLLGYDLSSEAVRPGEYLQVVIYWYATAAPEHNYASFVHFAAGLSPLAQADKPYPAERATREWLPGAYLRDEYTLHIPSDITPGDYQLNVGLYTCDTRPPGDCGNGDRLPVTDSNGGSLGDILTLAKVTVR